MRLSVILIVTGLALGSAGPANAYCSAPSPPSTFAKPEKPTPPQKPFCASMGSCDSWQIKNYNNEVERYNQALDEYQDDVAAYVRKLKDYIQEAQDYALCEVKSLDD